MNKFTGTISEWLQDLSRSWDGISMTSWCWEPGFDLGSGRMPLDIDMGLAKSCRIWQTAKGVLRRSASLIYKRATAKVPFWVNGQKTRQQVFNLVNRNNVILFSAVKYIWKVFVGHSRIRTHHDFGSNDLMLTLTRTNSCEYIMLVYHKSRASMIVHDRRSFASFLFN